MDERERGLADAFVTLADTLVHSYDVADFMYYLTEQCKELLDVDQCGLVLADPSGALQVMAATDESTRTVEILEVQNKEGPCRDAFQGSEVVTVDDLAEPEARHRWPEFVPLADRAGFRSVTALPMRLRDETIGALNLFRYTTGAMAPDDVAVAQALTDVATIGLLQRRAIDDAEVVSSQLQVALDSRVVIEQAKGIVSRARNVEVGVAFELLRRFSRDNGVRLTHTCREVVAGSLDPDDLPAAP
jgi:GAF domain-containing protein